MVHLQGLTAEEPLVDPASSKIFFASLLET